MSTKSDQMAEQALAAFEKARTEGERQISAAESRRFRRAREVEGMAHIGPVPSMKVAMGTNLNVGKIQTLVLSPGEPIPDLAEV